MGAGSQMWHVRKRSCSHLPCTRAAVSSLTSTDFISSTDPLAPLRSTCLLPASAARTTRAGCWTAWQSSGTGQTGSSWRLGARACRCVGCGRCIGVPLGGCQQQARCCVSRGGSLRFASLCIACHFWVPPSTCLLASAPSCACFHSARNTQTRTFPNARMTHTHNLSSSARSHTLSLFRTAPQHHLPSRPPPSSLALSCTL